ncbi:hypothetical protein BJ875DRAFT_143765 [Amylocarpus encephaloides]|uniref:DUF7918 domain-containing protein n=1 Tax=Amylocarpus encephaloides TaxID=45428 RepID=A0A9P7YBM6_9HELO|nr:hypothetical protein BJ875DRAFT_143765 [Amylocarpus encephaloides]
MAIPDVVPGLSVRICVDYYPPQEHEDGEDRILPPGDARAAKPVTCYVELTANRHYTVKTRVDQSLNFDCPNLTVRSCIDGSTHETIVVNGKRCVGGHVTIPPTVTTKGLYHEKAMKGQANSHSTRLTPPEDAQKRVCANLHELDGRDQHPAAFKFKYRSNEALKQLRIIKSTPSPSPQPMSTPSCPMNLTKIKREGMENGRGVTLGSIENHNALNFSNRAIKRAREAKDDQVKSTKRRRSR